MTPTDRYERQLSEALTDLADARVPSYIDDLLATTASTRQRPAWTFPERWLPMTFTTVRTAPSPSWRAAWTLALVGLLSLALAASLAVAGSILLRQNDPDALRALIPVLKLDESWTTSAASRLRFPGSLDVGPTGDVYVVSAGSDEIVVLDPAGRELRRWGGSGSGEGQFRFERDLTEPLSAIGGVAVAPDGSVYVADQANRRVQRFTPTGEFVRSWGGYGTADGQFLEPIDVAVGLDGSVYVVDRLRDDIQRFTPDGAWIETVGHHGSADGELSFTGGIDVAADGTLLNADFGNARVQAWAPDGSYLWSRDGAGGADGFVDPGDVGADRDGRVFVADAQGIKLLTEGETPVPVLRPLGWDGGWLAVADDGTVYATSALTGRVDRLTLDFEEPAGDSGSAATDAAEATALSTAPAAGDAPVTVGGPQRVAIDADRFPLPFTAELPSSIPPGVDGPGWRVQEFHPGVASFQYVRNADRWPAYVAVWLPADVYLDPCHPEAGTATLPDDPGVDELMTALTQMLGYRASSVSDISFGEVQGKTFELDNSVDPVGCTDDPWLRQWTYRAHPDSETAVGPSENLPGTHQRLAVVDVHGVPVIIEAWDLDALRDEVIEMESLFESIRFE